MKNVLKVGVIALALGFFATACNSGTSNQGTSDSTTNMEMAPEDNQMAPAAPMDTMSMDTSAMDNSGM